MSVLDAAGASRPGHVYGKVVSKGSTPSAFVLRFTSVAPEIARELQARLTQIP